MYFIYCTMHYGQHTLSISVYSNRWGVTEDATHDNRLYTVPITYMELPIKAVAASDEYFVCYHRHNWQHYDICHMSLFPYHISISHSCKRSVACDYSNAISIGRCADWVDVCV